MDVQQPILKPPQGTTRRVAVLAIELPTLQPAVRG
jgi:hypothetical protein